jgi:Dolichyl-phosphate-mannose-protein mannosyltransferase
MTKSLQAWRHPLTWLAAAALIAGCWFRFWGLGRSPFAVDEYYLSRSIENVLRTGIPAFPCGGLYMRGVILQYSAAALRLLGLCAELAPRVLSTLCTLITIPAAFIIGKRSHGWAVGILAVIIMALSVWEIELARFGRMYAPFQAVFLWYMVFFLRYTADRDSRAMWPMLALSAVAPLVWEGGVFLPLANLLSLFLLRWPNRPTRNDMVYLLGCGALVLAALWFVTADFRGHNADSWPAGYTPALIERRPDSITLLHLPLAALRQHLGWMVAAVIPLLMSFYCLRWIAAQRSRLFFMAGLLAMMGGAAAHQFLAVAAIGMLLILTRVTSLRELSLRAAAPFFVAIGLWAVFWVAYGIVTVHSQNLSIVPRTVAMLAYQYLSFPGFVTAVARPWAGAVPHLAAALLLLIGAAFYRALKSNAVSDFERVLLTTFLILLLATSASPQPREETRYVFFLYPLAVIIALGTLARIVEAFRLSRTAASAALSTLALCGFALSEDFQPHHLLHINDHTEAFRIGFAPAMQSHLVIRDDSRAIAQWLDQHSSDGHIVINAVHGLDWYATDIKYFFVDQHEEDFPDWSCRRGTRERWGNYPLLPSYAALESTVIANSKAYFVVFGYDIEKIMSSLAALHPRIAKTEGNLVILDLQG